MPGNNPQRRGTARTIPNFCVVLCIVCFVSFPALFVCICVLYYCQRVATQLQLNISYIVYHITSYHIIYYSISYHTISCHIISYIILYYIIYLTIAYHIIYHIISYQIIKKNETSVHIYHVRVTLTV
jgi:hypothetical protein